MNSDIELVEVLFKFHSLIGYIIYITINYNYNYWEIPMAFVPNNIKSWLTRRLTSIKLSWMNVE